MVARIAALFPWVVFLRPAPGESPGPLHYNLGAAPVDAKGTRQDYLTHVSRIPAKIMAVKPVFSEVVMRRTRPVLVIWPDGGGAVPVRSGSGQRPSLPSHRPGSVSAVVARDLADGALTGVLPALP